MKTMIKMKHKLFSWSGDDYTVYNYNNAEPGNKNGTPLCIIDGKAAVWNSLMYINDLNGNLMAILDGKTQWFGYTKFNLQNAANQTIAIITRDMSWSRTSTFFVMSPDQSAIYYTIEGVFWNHEFVVRNASGFIVGKSSRYYTGSGYRSYGVEVCKGFDYVLMVMIMAAVDEYKEQHSRSNNNIYGNRGGRGYRGYGGY